jgi:very-short-patch-repair endonuclease
MREFPATRDATVADIAGRQHGVISTGQLTGAGLQKDAIYRRVRAGRLHRVHRGVYAVGHRSLSPEGRMVAALLAIGNSDPLDLSDALPVLERWGAAVSHRSAAEHWGLLPQSRRVVDVSVSGIAGRSSHRGVRVHRRRSLSPGHVTLLRGIPTTKPDRTLLDLRRASARSSPLISPAEFRAALREAHVLGLPIGDGPEPDRTRSELERQFLLLCRRRRLPPPEVNVRVGRIEVDFLWRAARLVVELDGYRYHRGPAAFEQDRARDLVLRDRGYAVIRLTHTQLLEEPELAVKILGEALGVSP